MEKVERERILYEFLENEMFRYGHITHTNKMIARMLGSEWNPNTVAFTLKWLKEKNLITTYVKNGSPVSSMIRNRPINYTSRVIKLVPQTTNPKVKNVI